MNLFIIAFLQKPYHPIITNILKHFKVKNCHLVYANEKPKVPPFSKPTYYSFKDFYYKAPNIAKNSQIKPLDEKILKNLANCEINVLRMMDRFLIDFRGRFTSVPESAFLNYNYRKIFYLKHVRYWNHMLDENQIDLVIFGNIPHEIFTYIIFHLCKLKNIPTIVLYQTMVEDAVLFIDNFEEPNHHLKNIYTQLREDLKNVPESEIQLSKRFNFLLKKQTDKSIDSTPYYMKNIPIKRNPNIHPKRVLFWRIKPIFPKILYILYRFCTFRLNMEHLKYLSSSLKEIKIAFKKYRVDLIYFKEDQKIVKYYESLAINPDFSKKYIYVPLHLQPELSTSPLAGVFVDQQLVVQLLSFSVPEDIYIYVKENPKQNSNCRNKKFYDSLLENSNVRLINKTIDTYKLIENSIAVATCTGTAGWEALFREKLVLLFGTIFYQYMISVFRIKTLEDCQRAINQIINQNIKPTLKSIKIFLKAMELTSIEGYIDPDYKKALSITIEQNIKNISQALIEKIKLTLGNQNN